MEPSEYVLGRHDVFSRVRERTEPSKDVNKARRVRQVPGAAAELGVVELAVDKGPLDFLHVRFPIDLGVGDFVDDDDVEKRLPDKQKHRNDQHVLAGRQHREPRRRRRR
eukprot:Amastigsp_a215332_4.p3 type:complete len:109 gc:universal Amastigsp_a215332_4:385-59(-)